MTQLSIAPKPTAISSDLSATLVAPSPPPHIGVVLGYASASAVAREGAAQSYPHALCQKSGGCHYYYYYYYDDDYYYDYHYYYYYYYCYDYSYSYYCCCYYLLLLALLLLLLPLLSKYY